MTALTLALFLATFTGGSDLPINLDATEEARAQHLGKQIRCPMCQGMSIADSGAAAARAQLDRVRALVHEGKSDEEIRQYFVARYGEWALLKPSAEGVNLIIWVAPIIALLVGLALVFGLARRGNITQSPRPKTSSESDEYIARVRAELEQ